MQNQVPIRELGVVEIVAMALDKRRRENRESRRVVLFLHPSMIPPKGKYETFLGEVKVFSKFLPDRGQWVVEVTLPPSGFSLGDHVRFPKKDSSKDT